MSPEKALGLDTFKLVGKYYLADFENFGPQFLITNLQLITLQGEKSSLRGDTFKTSTSFSDFVTPSPLSLSHSRNLSVLSPSFGDPPP